MNTAKLNTEGRLAEIARRAESVAQRINKLQAFKSFRDGSVKMTKGKKTLYKPLYHEKFLTERQLWNYFQKLITCTL